ncbi:MAG: MOSC N-terminal beta barrel domain-containing protein [Actinobacteria bacterium]|nr:MOSC N-terminal beta barrel domain-containing protein [Actinomycetota bacterium]
MQIAELWRYPVKSLQGERLDAVAVTADGLEGDRQFAIYDVESGLGLTGRRVPELLFASACMRADGTAEITLPDGSLAGDDNTLSNWLGRSVALRSAATEAARRYENVVDFEHESTSDWEPFDGAARAFHDNPGARVSLVSTATMGSWDPRRFRANVLLDGEGEDSLVGSRVTLGEATLNVDMRIKRCVMTTRAQAGGIERDLDVLRTIARERDACLAVGALVIDQGTIRVGDTPGANSRYRTTRALGTEPNRAPDASMSVKRHADGTGCVIASAMFVAEDEGEYDTPSGFSLGLPP